MISYSLPRLMRGLEKLNECKEFILMRELVSLDEYPPPNTAVLRLDVERRPAHHLKLARALAGIGIRMSLYFHTRINCYHPEIMREIEELGHEVGLHYECLDRTGGDYPRARDLFLREVDHFRKDGINIQTVCRHGESGLPMKGYSDGSDIFVRYPGLLAEAGLLGDLPQYYLGQDHWEMILAIDTFTMLRRFWPTIELAKRSPSLLVVLVHPHRWHASLLPRVWEVSRDLYQRYRNITTKGRTYRTVLDR